MKGEGVNAPKQSESIGKRRLYSPFKRNQMRWALAVYKWKSGVSWNLYHRDIAQELGAETLQDLKRFEQEKISNKDTKRFVVEGRKTTEEKLVVFEEFIRKVNPDYLTDRDEEDHLLSTAKSLAEFSNVGFRVREYEHWVVDNITVDSIFVAPLITQNSLLIRSLDCCVVRQISGSPFLFVQMFTLDLPNEIYSLSSNIRFLEKNIDPDNREDLDNILVEVCREAVLRFSHRKDVFKFKIRDYRKGISIPVGRDQHYSMMKTKDECPDFVEINFHDLDKTINTILQVGNLTDEENCYKQRAERGDTRIPEHLIIFSKRSVDARDKEKETSYKRRYFVVNELPQIKEKAFRMEFSLI